jgi:hypothetical protein
MMTIRRKAFFRNFVIVAAALGALNGGTLSAASNDRTAHVATDRAERALEQRALLSKTIEKEAARTLDALNAEWLADVELRLTEPARVLIAAN